MKKVKGILISPRAKAYTEKQKANGHKKRDVLLNLILAGCGIKFKEHPVKNPIQAQIRIEKSDQLTITNAIFDTGLTERSAIYSLIENTLDHEGIK